MDDADFKKWLVESLAASWAFVRDLGQPSIIRMRAEGRINALSQVADKLGIHELSEPVKLRYPGGKDGMYVVTCTCGYQSQPSGWPQRAEKPALAHKEAKEVSRADASRDA